MEIFSRRYLSLFACLFLVASACAMLLDVTLKIVSLVVIAILALITIIFLFILKKYRFWVAVVLTALIFIAVSVFNSLIFISIPQSKAAVYASETHSAQIRIISCEHSDLESSEYTVRIERIGEESVNIKAYLYCDFASELNYGDKMISTFYVDAPSAYDGNDRDILFTLNANGEYPVYYKNVGNADRFSIDGIRDICGQIRRGFLSYVDSVFGNDDGALVKAFLINDTSNISGAVKSDFRRAGITHLLAVSGLHIALLMGGLEILLRKMYVSKSWRCLIISLAALLLLVLADFSASAVRAVFMLYGVYVSYFMAGDHDTVTSLFVSVFLIVLFSPFSVYDLGMWMSFLATLGLVTVYAYIDNKLPRQSGKVGAKGLLFRLGLGALRAVLITLVANFFLLGIMWQFFGEISVAAIPANLILSPIATVYMSVSTVGLIIGWIPYLNSVVAWITGILGNIIMDLADIFANMRGSVISLRYPFAKALVILFCVSLAILLVVKLKHKLLVTVPAIGFVACFCVCMIISGISAQSELRYVGNGDNELLYIDHGSRSTVCDVTYGGYYAQRLLLNNRADHTTEIENYVFTHCYKGHASMIRSVLSRIYVRKFYIPLSPLQKELICADEIRKIAADYGSQIIFYDSGKAIDVDNDLTLIPNLVESFDGTRSSVFVCIKSGDRLITYTDATQSTSALKMGAMSNELLIGCHGRFSEDGGEYVRVGADTRVIFASEDMMGRTRIVCPKEQGSYIKKNGIKILRVPLE